jgi:hypothetical protein
MEPQRTRHDRKRFTLADVRTSPLDRSGASADRVIRECPCCASELVQLVGTTLLDDDARHVDRRCPECMWQGAGRFTPQAVARYEQEQDAARGLLEALLGRIEQARMERDVDRFAHSLAHDQVLPEDF